MGLPRAERPTAIFAGNNRRTVGALQALERIDGDVRKPQRVVVPVELVARGSGETAG